MEAAASMMSHAEYVGTGLTCQLFQMKKTAGYPRIRPHQYGARVHVEVYEDPDWDQLDEYEGVPDNFFRKVIQVELQNGEVTDAYIYVSIQWKGKAVKLTDGIYRW